MVRSPVPDRHNALLGSPIRSRRGHAQRRLLRRTKVGWDASCGLSTGKAAAVGVLRARQGKPRGVSADARVELVAGRFSQVFGRAPAGVWTAPGRVNLIGEHTDYNDGYVLPVAIDRGAVAAVSRRDDGLVRAVSLQLGPAPEVALDSVAGRRPGGWIGYVAGVAHVLRETGLDVLGADVVVDSDVPIGAGLSSSAALECAVALALNDLTGASASPMELAVAAQRAEREVVGAPVGVMDQAAAMLGRRNHALFLDCRTLEAVGVRLDLAEADLALLVIDSGLAHAHPSGGYAERRWACDRAAHVLGVPALRDATPERLAAAAEALGPVLLRRARHVVSENARVLQAVGLLGDGAVRGLGPLLGASHASLRDDFEVSVPELDTAVAAAESAGALGARMIGGGFGGAALALVPRTALRAVRNAVMAAAAERGFAVPAMFPVASSDGGRRVR